MSSAPPLLLLDRPFRERTGLEPGIWDRIATFDRNAVGTGGKSRLGALERCELDPQLVTAALVELVLVEVLGVSLARLDTSIALERSLAIEGRQRLLDPGPFVCKELAGAL